MSVAIDDLRLFRFVVRIETDPGDGTGFLGSGFLAAPGLVLTCAHVVAELEDGEAFRAVSAVPEVNAARAVVRERSAREAGPDGLWAWPDLAVVELLDAEGRRETRHPLPRNDFGSPVPAGPVRRRAFIAARPNPESAASVPVLRGVDFRWESLDGQGFWWLADGHALPGMSGGMLVDPERGAICAVINNSRGLGAAIGSVATPLSALGSGFGAEVREQAATGFSAVPEWDAAFTRRSDVPWRDAWNPGVTARHFVGRAWELKRLQDNLEKADGLAVVQSIGGFGGVGKTALAVAFAERCRDRFDGRVFHDFESYRGARADTAADALGSVLTGIGAATPKEVELLDHRARAERWRAAASGRRLLMVWDNVDSLEQLDGLLIRSDGCATIVTTRDIIRIDDEDRTLRLDVLEEADAIAMFLEIAGDHHPREPVTELVRRDLCVPVLIATHAREVANEEVALDEIIDDLPEPSAVRSQAGAYLQRDLFDRLVGSYRRLEPEERVAFRAFGAHPGAIATLGSLAAAMECPIREASRRMRGLVRAGLAERDLSETSGGERDLRRYRAHDLLRVYGAHLAEEQGDLNGSRAALAQFYLDRLGRDFGEHPEWFMAEVETIHSLCVSGETDAYAHLGRFLGYRGVRYSAFDAAEAGFRHADRLDRARGDIARIGHDQWGLGDIARLRGDLATAASHYWEALGYSRTADDLGGIGNALRGLGEVAQLRGDDAEAEAHYTAARGAYREGGFGHRVIYVDRGLGQVAMLRGDFVLATALFRTALVASLDEGDLYGSGFALLNLGEAALAAGDLSISENHLRESMEVFKETGDPVKQADALRGLGKAALAGGDTALARERLEAAAAVYRRHDAARNLNAIKAEFERLEAAERAAR